eukprot:3892861-Lingulodinium_polyedra.AAC.1
MALPIRSSGPGGPCSQIAPTGARHGPPGTPLPLRRKLPLPPCASLQVQTRGGNGPGPAVPTDRA